MPYSSESFKSFNPTGEIIVALLLIGVLAILAIVVGILAKHADPTKKPRG